MLRKSLFWLVLVFVLGASSVFGHEGEHAWVRAGNFDMALASVDVYVDDMSVTAAIAPGDIGPYVEANAGMHSVAVTEAGADMADALVTADDVILMADHHYTLGVNNSGEMATISVLDEEAAFSEIDLTIQTPSIFVNNIQGLDGLDVVADGDVIAANVTEGETRVFSFPIGNYSDLKFTASGDMDTVIMDLGPIFFEPNATYVVAAYGTYPGEPFVDYSITEAGRSPLKELDFLAGFHDHELSYPDSMEAPFPPQVFKFDTFLSAVEAAGLTDMLNDGSYTLFVPTDEAFAALPAGTLDAWMANPDALKEVLSYHVVEGSHEQGELIGSGMIQSAEGASLSFMPDERFAFTINGDEAGCGCHYGTANGIVYVIDHVLTPMEATPSS